MSSMLPPASSIAAFKFSHTWRVCASTSPMPAIVPSARRAVMPEMKTMRPRAATIVAWEKWPDGWRIFAEVICCLGMRLLLRGETGRQSAGRLALLWQIFRGTGFPNHFFCDSWVVGLLEGPTMVSRTSDWRDELGRWLKPFLDRLGHKARRQMCPLYVSGLIGPGDRKSIQPMAKRLAL